MDHNFYIESDTLLFADVFENFRNKVLIYMDLTLLIFISTWISMGACLKNIGIELELVTDIDMLLMVGK